jgi:DNA-binding response OmpR family regulator
MPDLKRKPSILIVEPNLTLVRPYAFLPTKAQVTRLSNSVAAAALLQEQSFDLVFLSCSFSSKKLLHFLDELKETSKAVITPLVLMVDLSKPFSIVPGLTWDKRLRLLSSSATARELELALTHLL